MREKEECESRFPGFFIVDPVRWMRLRVHVIDALDYACQSQVNHTSANEKRSTDA
jgi:hypothetical protein